MILLAFETATPSGGAALLRGERLLGCMTIGAQRQHSRLCLDLAAQLLETEGLHWRDVDVLAASHGPGSFTGVRVGLTHAKALAFANGKPLVTVNALEAMALHAVDGDALVLALQDARKGEFYAALYERDGASLRTLLEPVACPVAKLPELLAPWRDRQFIACGEGAFLPGAIPEGFFVARARPDRALASPAATALLALREARAGRFADVSTAAPLYLRSPFG